MGNIFFLVELESLSLLIRLFCTFLINIDQMGGSVLFLGTIKGHHQN